MARLKERNKCLEHKFFHDEQDWSYEAFWSFLGQKLHIHIRRNAYDFQSFAHCTIYDRKENKWNMLVTIPHAQMACLPVSYVSKLTEGERALFKKDEQALLDLAAKILQ